MIYISTTAWYFQDAFKECMEKGGFRPSISIPYQKGYACFSDGESLIKWLDEIMLFRLWTEITTATTA